MSEGRRRWLSQHRQQLHPSSVFRSIHFSNQLADVLQHRGTCFSLLSLQIQCLSLSEISLQTYPEMFHRLLGHPLAQSKWHIKLIITMIQMPTAGISLAFQNCVPGRGNNILKDSEVKGKQHLQVTEVLKLELLFNCSVVSDCFEIP